MELEPLDTVLGDQAAGALHGVWPRGVDAREREEHVRIGRSRLRDLLVRDRRDAASRLPVDGEDDGGHVPLPVVRREVVDGRQRLVGAEVARRGRAELGRHRIVPVSRELGVDVHVDRGDGLDVDHGVTVPSSAWSAVPHASTSQSAPGAPIRETLVGSPLRFPTPDGRATTGNPVQSQ